MVELEKVAFGAAVAVLSNEGALAVVPLVHGTPDRSRDVTRRRLGLGLFDALSWCLRLAKALRFETLELLGHGLLDDGREITVRHRSAHECLESL